jgi:hypothetical protein
MTRIPHILSSANVTVYLDGQPNVVPVGTAQYDLVLAAIGAGSEQGVRDAINVRQAVVNMSQGKITLNGSTLTYDGRPMHGALVNRILTTVKDAGNAGPLILFLENLMSNPSKRAVDELYGFLEACDLPITDDGHFLAYKKIRNDYRDIYTGTLDNSVGQVLEVPRNSVDEDKDNTCSFGLHFCSKSYLPQFGRGDGNRIVVVKVNPADVVAIPSDYRNAKGRTCRYEVMDEVTTDGSDVAEELKSGYEGKYAKPAPVAPAAATVAPVAAAKATASASPVGVGSLTDQQVRNIRALLAENWPLSSIAKSEGTSARTVARIRDGETYTNVK